MKIAAKLERRRIKHYKLLHRLIPSIIHFHTKFNFVFSIVVLYYPLPTNKASSIQRFINNNNNKKMGIPSELRDAWVSKRNSFIIASPDEERKILRTKKCTNEGVRAGFKAAAVACVVSTVPTLAAVRMIPWAKANLNYTAQALIISAASIAAYFITADKTILECARKNAQLENSLRHHRDTVSS